MQEDILELVADNRLVYISGKTCTGKTTLSKNIALKMKSKVVETDSIVNATKHKTEANKFVEIYRNNKIKTLVDEFVLILRNKLNESMNLNGSAIFEGGVANNDVLKQIISGWDNDFLFIYLHPINANNYVDQITSRFILSTPNFNSGLPPSFWKLIDTGELHNYYKSRELNEGINGAINLYAKESMKESKHRLAMFKSEFDVHVIEV